MRKGKVTKLTILEKATEMASKKGLEGLSIGQLASALEMSKSGLFAHFGSKEELQIQVLQSAANQFSEKVSRPALKLPRGAARLQALFEFWLEWGLSEEQSARGGCLFVASAIELDDQPGPVRDALVQTQEEWIGVLERTFVLGQESGLFKAELDPATVIQEIYGLLLSTHFYVRLLGQRQALERVRKLFSELIKRIQN
jgi:AcrR family transcriptional regulator